MKLANKSYVTLTVGIKMPAIVRQNTLFFLQNYAKVPAHKLFFIANQITLIICQPHVALMPDYQTTWLGIKQFLLAHRKITNYCQSS